MRAYNHKKIEKKWREEWKNSDLHNQHKNNDDKKSDFYILDMFPYPSGDGLHMGHTESYTASDILYRYKRMQGFNVLHPQGFDSFGLPAENYAIKTGTHPKETTKTNANNYIEQMRMLGLGHDLDHLVYTSDPKYYKWTQWLFGKFFENGLVEQKTDTINWCSSCNTGLANEQVEQGKCERCKTEIEQKEVKGWFFKITDFADELIGDLDKVDWPEATKKNQKAWIGRSEGASIKFPVIARSEATQKSDNTLEIEVFTTRPDTLFGATYLVLAPEHELISKLQSLISNNDEIEKYVKQAKNKTEMERMEAKEKTGVKLEGITAVNPANNEEIPIYIADYVLGGYGTGAIMAVPAHDERDFEFAKKYSIDIKQVITPKEVSYLIIEKSLPENFDKEIKKIARLEVEKFVDDEWGHFWRVYVSYKNEIDLLKLLSENLKKEGFYSDSIGSSNFIVYPGEFFRVLTNSDLEKFKKIGRKFGIPEKQLDVTLKPFTGSGVLINSEQFNGMDSEEAKKAITEFVGGKMTTNYRLRDWSISRQRYWGCPIPVVYSEDGEAKYVGDENLPWMLPEDVDFVPTGEAPLTNSKELKERTEKLFGKEWKPEVDTMDTFVDSAWYFLRYPDTENEKEFCSQEMLKKWLPVDLYIGGAEHTYMHLLYARFFIKALKKMGLVDFNEPFTKLRHQGMVLDKEGVKMSKSKGNVVNPNDMVERFGADAVRLNMMFAGPLEDDVMWNEDGVVGVYRFLERVWKLHELEFTSKTSEEVERQLHKTIKKVENDIEELKYNTAISAMMVLSKTIEKEKEISQKDFESFLKILSPFAPFMTQELWSKFEHDGNILEEEWIKYDEEKTKDDTVTIAVQVNGKVRDQLDVAVDIAEEEIKKIALESEKVQKWLDGSEPKKVIYVKGRLVSVVV